MKKILTLILLMSIGFVSKSYSANFSTTISSTSFSGGFARSAVLVLNPNESMTYSLTGSATGQIYLEKSIDGQNFVAIISSTNNSGGVRRGTEYSNEMVSFYRWSASTMTGAGSFIVTLSDNDDFYDQLINNKKLPIFQLWDDTIRLLNNTGFLMSDVVPSTSTTSMSRGTAYPIYLTGSSSVLEGSVVVATTPVAGQGAAVVLAPTTLNQGRWFGIAKSSSNVGLPIHAFTSGIVLALTTGTVNTGDMLGTSNLSAGYLQVTQSSQPVVGIALSNGISAGGLTKIRMR